METSDSLQEITKEFNQDILDMAQLKKNTIDDFVQAGMTRKTVKKLQQGTGTTSVASLLKYASICGFKINFSQIETH